MSKFCPNCNRELVDEAVLCPDCGTSLAPAPAPKADNAFTKFVNKVVDFVKAKPKLVLIGAGAAVAAIAVIVVVSILLTNLFGYKSAINNMIDVSIKGKASKIEKLAPKEYWDWYEEEYDRDINDIIEDFEEEYDDMMDELEDEYGKNIRVSYEVTKEKKLSDKKVEKIGEALEDRYDISSSKVTAAYELEVEMTIKGSEDDDEEESELTVVKISGKWYVVSCYEYNDEYYVSFMTGF